MSLLPTAPRPIAGVLGDALRLYRASFSRCWVLALVGAILNAVVGSYQTRSLADLSSLSLGDLSTSSLDDVLAQLTGRIHFIMHSKALWLSSLAQLLVWLLICAALIARQHAVAIGREDTMSAALALSLRRLPGALTAGIVSTLLVAAGLLLLIVPGLWVGGLLQLWFVPLCVEEVGPWKALGRSWQLVERHWWHASTVVGLAITIVAILPMASDVMAGAFVAVSHGTAVTFLKTSELLDTLVSVFSMPLLTVVMLALYYDLKLRREGSDSAERPRSLQRA